MSQSLPSLPQQGGFLQAKGAGILNMNSDQGVQGV